MFTSDIINYTENMLLSINALLMFVLQKGTRHIPSRLFPYLPNRDSTDAGVQHAGHDACRHLTLKRVLLLPSYLMMTNFLPEAEQKIGNAISIKRLQQETHIKEAEGGSLSHN